MSEEKKKNNPMPSWALALNSRLTTVETEIKWLKRGYWLQTLLGAGTFLSVLALILKLVVS
ncbi:MAG: hypothetical protein DRN26_02780 [Thermoplasmata archaeon]|nr:MAG: hypothetical protein DRN26_02780 [Thermoplasmata archaeon]